MKELSVVYRGFGASVLLGTLADDGKAVLFQYNSPQAIEQRLELSPLRLPLRQQACPDGWFRRVRWFVGSLIPARRPQPAWCRSDPGFTPLPSGERQGEGLREGG